MTPRPMFPLGTVVVPGASIPLRLFEPRYLTLIDDVLGSDRRFGTCLIERGSEVGGGDIRLDVGTLVEVRDARRAGDGHWLVDGIGLSRIRVVDWLVDDPYPRAEVEDFPDPEPGAAEIDQLQEARAALVATVEAMARRRDVHLPDDWLGDLADDPSLASFQLVSRCPFGPLDAHRLLAAPTVGLRCALLLGLLSEVADLGPGG